jgi:hypothetical protein
LLSNPKDFHGDPKPGIGESEDPRVQDMQTAKLKGVKLARGEEVRYLECPKERK